MGVWALLPGLTLQQLLKRVVGWGAGVLLVLQHLRGEAQTKPADGAAEE